MLITRTVIKDNDMSEQFHYDTAFSRNIGWVTETEQALIKTKRIAIAGMGGVGGEHLLSLVRLGITRFNLADFDEFGCENSNRQAGANVDTYGCNKLDTMVDMALAINPELEINTFAEGINEANLDEFLADVDCYVDSLDFFALDIRRQVFALCYQLEIPATTAAPIGMGTAYLNFMPGKMSFEDYFRLEGLNEHEQYLRFFLGLTPSALQAKYLVDKARLDLANKKGPSTVIGCKLAAGVATAQVVKILLQRGDVLAVPRGLHFDAYRNQFNKTWRPWGNHNPIQQLAFALGRRKLNIVEKVAEQDNSANLTLVERVLDLARWAPSGDNAQSWRFKIENETSFTILASDTSEHCVYDVDRHSSHIAHGMLLETIEIAASQYQHKIKYHIDDSDISLTKIHVKLILDESLPTDELAPYVKIRSVQRRPMGSKVLSVKEQQALESCLPQGFYLQWFDSFKEKFAIAKLNFINAKTRLSMKEAYEVHRDIIEWNAQFSKTKIPDQALGVDWLTARLMQWMFESWQRVSFMNKYLAGTLAPRINLDFIPSMRCSCHFVIKQDKAPETVEEYIAAGKVVQRFWLMATKLGLGFQPEITPIIFAKYLRQGINFTRQSEVIENAICGKTLFESVVTDSEKVIFLGRLGRSEIPKSRSTRIDLKDLIVQ